MRSFCFYLTLILTQACYAQQSSQAHPQPLNASISNFGTTFVFAPQPICSGCVESELGFLSVDDGGHFLPATLSLAPLSSRTDFSVLLNLLDSRVADGRRATHFGDRIDLVVRQQLLRRGGFALTVAPRGAILMRDLEGGRAGGTVAAQYLRGNNLGVVNLTYTGAIDASPANPRFEHQGSFNYFRTLSERGYALFAGLQYTQTTGNSLSLNTEGGIVIPFRNGQLELDTQQLNLSTQLAWQFQARVTVNWGDLLRK